ncbi:MAG: molybdate ABC transporter substrate-binding protein [Shimia sp.]
MRWLLVLFLYSALPAQAERVVIFAAASLKAPLDRIVDDWPGEAVVSYGASSALARQIELGAPADVYLSANPVWAEWLAERRPEFAATAVFARNSLVIVGDGGPLALTPEALSARLGPNGRLVTAETTGVPLGLYTQAAFEALGLWHTAAPRLLPARNALAAAQLMRRGEAPLGVLYASDASGLPIVATIPADAHPPILYTGRAAPRGAAFLALLRTPAAQAHLREAGFAPPP